MSGKGEISVEPHAKARFELLVERALAEGATKAKLIPAKTVTVDERVRFKCEFGCPNYGRFLKCPPHTMSIERFSKILSLYEWALLVQVEADLDSSDKSGGPVDSEILQYYENLHRPFKLKLHCVVEAVEAEAFKLGMRFAAGLVGGECVLCEKCVDDKVSETCRFPFRARPSMDAVGIDVCTTAEKAGVPIHLSSSEKVLWTGLVLLE